jgi:hypothetical protein
MLDEQVEHAEPTTRAILRTIALAVIGLVIGAVIAILGLATVMTVWLEIEWV